MFKMSGAQLIVSLLERQGVRVIPGIPGGANLPLYDALSQSKKIRHILARHEQGAGFMAQGIARATGQVGVCFATSGPGATNIITALADAKLDSVPVVCITGQVPTALIGTDAFQEVDTYGMTLPITKHNYSLRSVEDLLTVIPEAFRIAASGRPGPVVVDVPKDIQLQTITFSKWPEPGKAMPAPRFNKADVEKAVAMINAAQRPVLYVGGGAVASEAAKEILALAEKASIPAAMTLMGLGLVPPEHPAFLGMLGMHAAKYTNLVLEECDLLIAAGVRFDDRATGKVAEFCPNAKIIHIDIDAAELGKIKQPQVGIVADLGQALRAMFPGVKKNARREWSARVRELKQQYPLATPGADRTDSPYGLILQTARCLDRESIITTDVGQHQMWTAQAYPLQRPRQWLTSGGLGTMGFGFPAALGAALACPKRKVVCFSGDGSLMMNIQELATAAEENINVKIILIDNNGLGLVRQQQELFYKKNFYASDFRRKMDFIKICEGFGVKAYDLDTAKNPAATLAYALGEEGPCLIHATIAAEEKAFPMVAPGGANRDMIVAETQRHTAKQPVAAARARD